jgi:hypothetical protein
VTAELEGFSTIEYPRVVVTNGRNTQMEITLSSAFEDVITITEESPLPDERRIDTGAKVTQTELEKIPTAKESNALFREEVEGLQQGLVGGVKPLPVSIPESGKALAFSAVLPPPRVTVELDVKAKR